MPVVSRFDWKGNVVEIVYERVAAIDVGKREIAVTVRTPGQRRGPRTQQTRKFRTYFQVLRQMARTVWVIRLARSQSKSRSSVRATRSSLSSCACPGASPSTAGS